MKTIVQIKIIALLLFFGISNLMAQEEKDVTKLKEQLAGQQKQIEQLKAEVATLDSTLRVERKDGKSARYKKQIEQLKRDSVEQARQWEAKLQQTVQEKDAVLTQRDERHKADAETIAALKQQLNGLQVFRAKWLAELASEVDGKWLNKPYPAVDLTQLEADYQQYEEFAAADARVAEARNKLKPFVENVRLYVQAAEAVNSPYDKTKVESLIPALRTLRNQCTEQQGATEVKLLFWQLDNYAMTVKIFQKVIKAVQEVVNNETEHLFAWPLVQATLKKLEKESSYITALDEIPWLKEQSKAYRESLATNCVQPNAIADKIMALVP